MKKLHQENNKLSIHESALLFTDILQQFLCPVIGDNRSEIKNKNGERGLRFIEKNRQEKKTTRCFDEKIKMKLTLHFVYILCITKHFARYFAYRVDLKLY